MAKNKNDLKDPIKDLISGEDKLGKKIAKLESKAINTVRALARMARDEGDYSARLWLKTIARLV